jgi:hypothetical protein
MRPHAPLRTRLGLWLALLAFALKALVPAGYMIGTAHAEPLIVMCTSAGASADSTAAALLGDLLEGREHNDKRPAAGGECAFAALSAGVLAPASLDLHEPARFERVAPLAPHRARPASLQTGPPSPPRGPPLIA